MHLLLKEDPKTAASLSSVDVVRALNTIGLIYQRQGKLTEALSYYEQALAMNKYANTLARMGDKATSLENIGTIYDQQGKMAEALHYHKQAQVLKEEMRNPAFW